MAGLDFGGNLHSLSTSKCHSSLLDKHMDKLTEMFEGMSLEVSKANSNTDTLYRNCGDGTDHMDIDDGDEVNKPNGKRSSGLGSLRSSGMTSSKAFSRIANRVNKGSPTTALLRSNSGKLRKRKLLRVTKTFHKLMGHDLINTFANNCEKSMEEWILLLKKTTLPSNITSSDTAIATAFRAVDSVICERQGTYLLRRLAYIQLMRLFASLKDIIQSDRENGLIRLEPSERVASIAMKIYLSTQEKYSNTGNLRNELKERKRSGRSWTDLARPSPLFVLMYSDSAETIVYVKPSFEELHTNYLKVRISKQQTPQP